ncbi:hypothetical protein [Cellulomonas endometrii]|uniref:hypothetical protein n=1 Tax=Cellulomonas endometrii TaxID=3036301 RepID=UPI0024AC8F9A|nr:hypothetical protein [Cellulomonas endometrii]
MTATPPATAPAPAPSTARSRRVIAAVVVVVLVALGAAAALLLGQQREDPAALARLDSASAALEQTQVELGQITDLSGEWLTTRADDADPELLAALADAHDAAVSFDASTPTEGSAEERAAETEERAETGSGLVTAVNDAIGAIATADYYAEVAESVTTYEQARAELDAAVAAGQQALAAGTGSPAAQDALRVALDAAAALPAVDVTTDDIDVVLRGTTPVQDAKAAVDAATAALAAS